MRNTIKTKYYQQSIFNSDRGQSENKTILDEKLIERETNALQIDESRNFFRSPSRAERGTEENTIILITIIRTFLLER